MLYRYMIITKEVNIWLKRAKIIVKFIYNGTTVVLEAQYKVVSSETKKLGLSLSTNCSQE